jgi:SHS2 domain-containing protein
MRSAAHRFVEHTGELELAVEAPTESGVFEEALAAFRTLVDSAVDELVLHELDISAADRALLLVAWLDELVFLAEVEDFVPDQVVALTLADGRLRATVAGGRGRPAHLVKAVTLNSLEFREEGGLWHARVVLDV